MHPIRPSACSSSFSSVSGAASSSDPSDHAASIAVPLGGSESESGSPKVTPLRHRRLSFHEDTVFHVKERDALTLLARRRERLAEQLQTRRQHLLGLWDRLQDAIHQEQHDAHDCGREPLSNAEQRLIETPLAAALGLIQSPKTVRTWRWEPFYRQTLPAIVALRGHELAMRLLPELSLMWAAMHDALEGERPRFMAGFFPETWRWIGELREEHSPFQKVMDDFSVELAQQDQEQAAAWRQEQLLGEALGILQAQHVTRLAPATAKIVAAAQQGPLAPNRQLSTTLLQLARVAIEERSTGLSREVLGAIAGEARCLPLSLGTGSGMASSSFQGGALARGPVVMREAPELEPEQLSEIPKLWRSLIQGAAPSHQPAFDDTTATARCLSLAYWISERALERSMVFDSLADLEGADQSILLEMGIHWVMSGEGMHETVQQRRQWWGDAQKYLKRQFQVRGASLLDEMKAHAWPGSSLAQFVLHQWARSLDRISTADALAGLEHAERVIRSSAHRAQSEGEWQGVREWAALWVAADVSSVEELRGRVQELLPSIVQDCEQAFRELAPRLEGIANSIECEAQMDRDEPHLSIGLLSQRTWIWELQRSVRALQQSWQALTEGPAKEGGGQEAVDSDCWALQGLLERWRFAGASSRSRFERPLKALILWMDQAKQLRSFAAAEPLPDMQRWEVQRLAKGIELEALQRLYGPWAAASQICAEALLEQSTHRHEPTWSLAEREELAMAIVERAQTAKDHDFVGAVCRNLLKGRPWAESSRKYEEMHRLFPAANAQGLRCRGRLWHAQDFKARGPWLAEQCRVYLQSRMRHLGTLPLVERRHPEVIAVASLLKLVAEAWPEEQQESFLEQMAPFIAIQPEPILAALRRGHESALVQRITDAMLPRHRKARDQKQSGAPSGSQAR